ncbi:MAG: hypothetical protein WBV94_03845 [Blastocatellia bacterium]
MKEEAAKQNFDLALLRFLDSTDEIERVRQVSGKSHLVPGVLYDFE